MASSGLSLIGYKGSNGKTGHGIPVLIGSDMISTVNGPPFV